MLTIPDGKLQLAHILRATLPWRDPLSARTECGRDSGKVTEVTDLETAARLVSKVGKQRASMQLCITCWETAGSWPRWEENPGAVIAREAGAVGGRFALGPAGGLNTELMAVAALIEAHPGDFAELLESYGSAVSLKDARDAKRVARRKLR
jgi:hypothetical protein